MSARQSARVVKPTESFQAAESFTGSSLFHMPEGDGTKLGDIAYVVETLKGHGEDDELIAHLHRTLFGTPGKRGSRKRTIRNWSGTDGQTTVDTLKERLSSKSWTVTHLQSLCSVLGLEKSGSKENVTERIGDFLANPQDLGKKVPTKRKRAAAGKRSKKAKDPSAPKRPRSSYIFFCNSKRAEVRASHPDWGLGDVGKELGRAWKELGDEDKKEFEAQAAEDRARYDREMASHKGIQANGDNSPAQDGAEGDANGDVVEGSE